VLTKTVYANLHKNLQPLKEVGQVGAKMLYKEMKKERLRMCNDFHGDDRRGFLTIFRNALTVGESAGSEE
jgi:hypothetical protein